MANDLLNNKWTYQELDKYIKRWERTAYVNCDWALYFWITFKGRHLFEEVCWSTDEKFIRAKMRARVEAKLQTLSMVDMLNSWY